MPTRDRRPLCPHLPDFASSRAIQRNVPPGDARLHDLTPLVEQLSIDEAFADVSFLPDDPATIARTLQASINEELNLPCSIGVATNKLVAKIANNVGKAKARGDSPPNAITVVPPGQEAAFLSPLPIGELWGVGPKTPRRWRHGVKTIGDVAGWAAGASEPPVRQRTARRSPAPRAESTTGQLSRARDEVDQHKEVTFAAQTSATRRCWSGRSATFRRWAAGPHRVG